jgi:2-(1,2-epoxy-1,2-dihydrophenyl)acetyl-CoA isomerase
MRTLFVERRDGVFEIVLNRPEILNAANREMLAELDMATAEAEADGESGAVLLRGAGSHFMAGGDIRLFGELAALPPEARRRAFHALVAAVNPTMLRLRAMAKPVVVAVQGAAAGFGLSLVLAADLALAAEDAVFAAGYIHLGTSPDGAMTFTLPRTVGLKRAAELMLLGERFTARRALELGIVNRLVAADALADEARAVAARRAAGPRTAQARTKALLQAALGDDLAAQLEREAESFAACAASAEFVEGVRAFLDKRPPLFSRAASPPPPATPR